MEPRLSLGLGTRKSLGVDVYYAYNCKQTQGLPYQRNTDGLQS